MSNRALLSAAAVAATLGAFAPSATAAITVGDNIAGAKPGMSFAQVKKTWGKPSDVNRSGGKLVDALWGKRKLEAMFSYGKTTVHTVSTHSPKQVTAEGVHVGSTAAAVQAAYPTADCTARSCFLFVEDGISTGFNFTHGKVDSIALVGP